MPSNSRQDSYEAIWWLPKDETLQRGGVLELDRAFELRTMGTFSQHGVPGNHLGSTVLNGIAAKRAITLMGCVQKGSTLTSGGYASLTIGFDVALIGLYQFREEGDATFDRVKIELSNLTTWSCRRAVESEWSDGGAASMHQVRHPELVADVPGAVVRLSSKLRLSEELNRVSWETVEELELAAALPVLEIERLYIKPLRYLLNLAVGEVCDIKSFSVAQSGHSDPRPGLLWFDVQLYQGRAERPAARDVPARDMLFTLEQLPFSQLLPQWYAVVARCGLSLDLLFALSSTGNIYVSNRLFNAVSAVEGLHQRLYPESEEAKRTVESRKNAILAVISEREDRAWLRTHLAGAHRPFLRERLNQLLDRTGSVLDRYIGNRELWITKVKSLRDQIGHGAEGGGVELAPQVRLTATLELLYRVILLRELGFTDSQCADMVNNNRNWSYLPGVMRSDVPELFL